MKKEAFDTKAPIDKRVAKIEMVLRRILNRVHKNTSAVISPQLISAYSKGDINGEVLNTMLFKGMIGRAAVFLNKKPSTPIAIEAKMLSGGEGITKTFYADRSRRAAVLDVPTYDGTILSVSVRCEDKDINELYIALLWTPHVELGTMKKQMIDELEAGANDYLIEE